MRVFAPDLLRVKGLALLGLGHVDEAREIFEEALAEAERQGSRRSLWAILFALSQLEGQSGNPAEAENLRRRAREFIEYIADHLGPPERRELFLKLPHIREVTGI